MKKLLVSRTHNTEISKTGIRKIKNACLRFTKTKME